MAKRNLIHPKPCSPSNSRLCRSPHATSTILKSSGKTSRGVGTVATETNSRSSSLAATSDDRRLLHSVSSSQSRPCCSTTFLDGSPSWPDSFQPQAYTSSSAVTAKLCQKPAAARTTDKPATASTCRGVSEETRSPWPSAPRLHNKRKKR